MARRPQELDHLAASLGYANSSGYVDDSVSDVGARDFVWRDLKRKCRIDAAFFRGAVPLVAFVDADSTDAAGAAHRRLWNFGRVPVLIASTPDEVLALSCSIPPARDGAISGPLLRSARPDQPLDVVLREFTRFGVESGRATAEHASRFQRAGRVDRSLLGNLRTLRSRLTDADLSSHQIERLLGRSIFIRYLEDRRILSAEHLRELVPFSSFNEVLRAGSEAVGGLFAALAEHFNGDVFASDDSDAHVPDLAFTELSQFFSGTEMVSGQQALWPYDFSVIPTELISSIYEQLLEETQRRDAAYYTPRNVVDLVLDELLPWDAGPDRLAILDPSCGSGIFLTEAFKRLAYRHSVAQRQQRSFAALSELLTSTIHGVDQSRAAIGVSAFGLYLALLEHVDLPTAWRDARLPELVGQNLILSDFFESHNLSNRRFDIIVGNPPWKSSLTRTAARYVSRADVVVPDRQIAIAFLWRSVEQIVDDGAVGLVLPAKSLLHNRSQLAAVARRNIFSSMYVETLMDLSPLRKDVFGASSNPAVVAIVRQRARDGAPDDTLYVVPRKTPLSEAVDGIVVPQDSIRPIPRGLAITSSDVWKTQLWGAMSDHQLITRLRESYPALSAIAEERLWAAGAGFQVKGGDLNDASELVGLPLIETKSVESMRLLAGPIGTVTQRVMHRPRDIRIYRAPHVLMRNGFREYPMSVYVNFDAAFPDGLFGLASPPSDARELRVISGLLNSSVARYWYFMTSSSWGVEREKLELNEYLSLPVPPFSTRQARQIDRCVLRAAEVGLRNGDQEMLDEAVFDAYELTEAERDLVIDGLSYRLDEFQHGARSGSYRAPTREDLDDYAELLAGHLRATESVNWEVSLGDHSSGYVVVTCVGETARTPNPTMLSIEDLMASAESPLDEWRSPAAVLQPSLLVVDGMQVHLVKPDQARSWTRSTARSDAVDVVAAVLMAPRLGRDNV